MKLILDTATANRTAKKSSLGAPTVPLGDFLPGSAIRAISGIRSQSLPLTDRERSSARAPRAATPAPDPGGVPAKEISRFEQANSEWIIWRFGEEF